METCASVCDGTASGEKLSSADILIQQSYAVRDEVGLLSNIRDLYQMMAKKEELMLSVKLQQQAMQASLALMEESIVKSRKEFSEMLSKMHAEPNTLEQEERTTEHERECKARRVEEEAAAALTPSPQQAEVPEQAPRIQKNKTALQLASGHHSMKQTQSVLREMGMSEAVPPLSEGVWPFLQAVSKRLVESQWFEFFILAVIIFNSVMIGVQSQMAVSGEELPWASFVEVMFLVIYSIEIMARAVAGLFDGWFFFDLLLVLGSYAEQIMSLLLGAQQQQLMLLRLLRLFRLIRSFRMVKQVKPIWRLVHGLMTAGDTVLSTFLLLLLVLYVFGVLGLELIAADAELQSLPETGPILEKHFSSLGMTMITLAQFVTMDSIAAVYVPLVKVHPWLMLYFSSLIAIVSITVMNLVTAAMVDRSLENARALRQEDERIKSASTKKMFPEILALFDEADADGSGELAIEEMQQFEAQGKVPEQILDRASVGSMTELFHVLDVDQSGIVTKEEFAEGLLDILLRDVSVSSLQQMKMLRIVREALADLQTDVNSLKQQSAIL